MPSQNSIVVCQPKVSFSQRLTDANLQRLTVVQLRKRARNEGLDVSRLTQKWEFVHVLVQQRTHGAQPHIENVTDPKRHTIFDLPGEIRKKIYCYVLADEKPIVAQYESVASCYPPRSFFASFFGTASRQLRVQSPTIAQLRNMSWVNRELRKEVRGFFFSHNNFEVTCFNGPSHVNFLNDIGADGRANIAMMYLGGAHLWMKNDDYTAIHDYVTGKSKDWLDAGCKIDVSAFKTSVFALLPALQTLTITCAISTWYNTFGNVQEHRQKIAEGHIKMAVLEAVQEALAEKGVKVTVLTACGAPRLSIDP